MLENKHIHDHSKMYAVSYINWFDHELKTEFVYADNVQHAMLIMLEAKDTVNDELSVHSTVEEIKQWAFDCDSMVHAAEVP